MYNFKLSCCNTYVCSSRETNNTSKLTKAEINTYAKLPTNLPGKNARSRERCILELAVLVVTALIRGLYIHARGER